MQEVTRLLWCEGVLQLTQGEVMEVDTGVKTVHWVLLKIRPMLSKIVPHS